MDGNPRYFPPGIFAAGYSDGSFVGRWFRKQLRALKEPSLFENPSAPVGSTYRFTWLRTFHHPIAVRVVVHANGTGTLTAKMADGHGGYDPGKLIANSTREISVKEAQRLLNLVETLDFWKMSTESGFDGKIVLDGAEWILEASRRGDYHVIERASPEEGPLRELGLYLALTLGKLDVPADTIY